MPICEGCGSSFEDKFKFCPYCGRSTPGPKIVQVDIREAEPVNACPVCLRNDKVEKVSVIFMHGSRETTMSVPVTEINSDSEGRTYSTTRHEEVRGLDETKLAQALRPPAKPPAPSNPVHFLVYLIGIGFVSSIPCLCLTGFILNLFATVFGIREFYDNSSMPPVFMVLVAVLFLMWLFLVVWLSARLSGNSKKSFQKKTAEYNSSAKKQWELSMDRWNTSYFCQRDGLVFIPGEKPGMPLENMKEFISARRK